MGGAEARDCDESGEDFGGVGGEGESPYFFLEKSGKRGLWGGGFWCIMIVYKLRDCRL